LVDLDGHSDSRPVGSVVEAVIRVVVGNGVLGAGVFYLGAG